MAKRENSQPSGDKEFLTYNGMHDKFKAWVLNLGSGDLKKYAILAVVAVIVLPGIATLLSFPRFLLVVTALPAALGLFLIGLTVAFIHERKKPDWITIKERYSFNQRLKSTIFGGIVVLAFMVPLSAYLPYAYGGVIVCAIALAAYNTIIRTPVEIEYDEQGIMDPRDEKAEMAREARSLKNNKKKRKSVDDE